MINIKVGIGNDFSTTIIKIKGLGEKLDSAVQNQLFIEGLNLRQEMITSMRETPRGGRSYSSGRVRPHISSKPYHPPAIDYGNLVGAFIIDQDRAGVEVGVGLKINLKKGPTSGSLASYAENLEFGTKKMAPRPFMQPALNKQTPGLGERLKKAMMRIT